MFPTKDNVIYEIMEAFGRYNRENTKPPTHIYLGQHTMDYIVMACMEEGTQFCLWENASAMGLEEFMGLPVVRVIAHHHIGFGYDCTRDKCNPPKKTSKTSQETSQPT